MSFKKFYVVSGYSIAYSGAENLADLPPTTKEQDIECAQHHCEGNTDSQGYTNEVIMLYFHTILSELTNQYLHYDKMQTEVLKSKKKEVVAETGGGEFSQYSEEQSTGTDISRIILV